MPSTLAARTRKAQLDLKTALMKFRSECEEIEKRGFSDENTKTLARELKQLCDNLLEWGEYSGHITVWGTFTPSYLSFDQLMEAENGKNRRRKNTRGVRT